MHLIFIGLLVVLLFIFVFPKILSSFGLLKNTRFFISKKEIFKNSEDIFNTEFITEENIKTFFDSNSEFIDRFNLLKKVKNKNLSPKLLIKIISEDKRFIVFVRDFNRFGQKNLSKFVIAIEDYDKFQEKSISSTDREDLLNILLKVQKSIETELKYVV